MNPAGPIVITGFMGCGKTGVARELARRLDLPMTDLDEIITQQQGRTAAQIIVQEGEPAFRAIETNVLRELLESRAAGVIALGGGAWITAGNRDLINQHGGVTVWLDTPFEVCWARIEASEDDRPLGRTQEQAEELYKVRQPVYRLADVHLQVRAEETVESILTRILELVLQSKLHLPRRT